MKFQIQLFAALVAFPWSASPMLAEEPYDPLVWRASASGQSGNARKAIDSDSSTRWDTGDYQAVGQWFQIDMRDNHSISRVEIDTTLSANDYPRTYELAVSPDGTQWKTVARGEGSMVTRITLPMHTNGRYFRISIPEGSELAGGYWSIHDLRVFGGQRAVTLRHPAMRWRTTQTDFPTRDVVIAAYDIRDFGIDPAAGADATLAIETATALLARAGGGTLWLPAGRYRLSEPITIRDNVCMRGDWRKPEPGKPIRGTIFEMTANRGNAEGAPGITVTNAACVKGIAFWYPEQTAAGIVPYPVTVKQIGGNGMGLEDVTFVNAYRGFECGPETCALFFLRNIHGTVLETGIKVDSTVDIGRMEMLRFSPRYWAGSALPGAPPADGPHVGWMRDHGTGLVFRRNDWSYTYDVEIEGYQTGLRTLPSLGDEDVSRNRKSYSNGNHAALRFIFCRIGAHFEDVAHAGFMIHDSEITGSEIGILADETFAHTLQLTNCRITGTPVAIRLLGTGQILVTNSDLEGTIENPAGYISFAGGKTQVRATRGAADGKGMIAFLPDPGIPPIKSPYSTPTDRTAPPTTALAVVTDPVFGAKADAKAGVTAAIEAAIKAVIGKGGGTVFFPAGEYRITRLLTIPTGVELRGVSESPHHSATKGSVIHVIPGRGQADGTPFITLLSKSGLRGLTFHYPEQDSTDIQPYPWMIRGNGEEIRAINVSSTMPYQILDFATHRCDRHYIDYVAGHGLRDSFRIGGGSKGGRMLNCQLNAHYYAFTDCYANSPRRISPGNPDRYSQPVYDYAKKHGRAFVLEDCTDQIVFQNFVFGAKDGLVLTGGKSGPSGWCLGQGSDQCGKGLLIDRIGPGGMPLVNCQMVTVGDNGPHRAYVELSPDFKGTAYVLGLNSWGVPASAIAVKGGRLVLASTVITHGGDAMLRLEEEAAAVLTGIVLRGPTVLADLPAGRSGKAGIAGLVMLDHDKPVVFQSFPDIPESRITVRVPGTVVGVSFDPHNALPSADWTAHASVNAAETSRALDGDADTRWTTGRPAAAGDEYGLDLGRIHTLTSIRIDSSASANDFPKMMRILFSEDGGDWSDVVYSGRGQPDFRISFKPRKTRYILIRNLAESNGYWSIHEIDLSNR